MEFAWGTQIPGHLTIGGRKAGKMDGWSWRTALFSTDGAVPTDALMSLTLV